MSELNTSRMNEYLTFFNREGGATVGEYYEFMQKLESDQRSEDKELHILEDKFFFRGVCHKKYDFDPLTHYVDLFNNQDAYMLFLRDFAAILKNTDKLGSVKVMVFPTGKVATYDFSEEDMLAAFESIDQHSVDVYKLLFKGEFAYESPDYYEDEDISYEDYYQMLIDTSDNLFDMLTDSGALICFERDQIIRESVDGLHEVQLRVAVKES